MIPASLRGAPAPSPRHLRLGDALEYAAEGQSGLTFVNLDESEHFHSWSELRRRAQRSAARLRAWGVRPGDRVALILPTSLSFMDAFFGTLLAGAVPVPLYPPVRLGRLEEYHRATARMLTTSGARLLLSDARVGLLLGQALERARPELGLRSAEALGDEGGPAEGWEAKRDPEDLALIQFSSGSTVDPKPVALTHRQLLTHTASLEALMPNGPGELGVSWLPLYHDMGLIGSLLCSLAYPGPLVLISPEHFLAKPALWLRAISKYKATISAAPNFAYALCAKRVSDAQIQGVDLSSWKFALNGAEPVSPSVMQRFREKFGPHGFKPQSLIPVYGLSEASLAVTFSPSGRLPRTLPVDPRSLAAKGQVQAGARELSSVGRPLPGVEVEVRNDLGVLPEGHVGRIFVRGPSVMSGYFQQPEASRAALQQGWLDTGDLGFCQDGELYICGRAKDLVLIRGANHSPQEFEECLEGIEGLRAGCAVALGHVPSVAEEEELLILAECTPGARDLPQLEEEVRRAVLERTAVRPHQVRILQPGTLPRTSSGKLRRGEALRRYLAQELTPPRKMNPISVVQEMAMSAWSYLRAGSGDPQSG